MSVRIYNSLTKKKEELIPLEGKTVKMYVCGVTAYDQCHIGHARSLYTFDMIRRYLKYRGYDVRFIRNITDVDDKIINKAKEMHKTFEEVVADNVEAYYRDLEDLGIEKADAEPRATEHIPEMVKAIETLVKKGFAYNVDGDVYYDVRRFKDYGKLSGQSIDKMEEAVRIEQDERKKDPLDFALWKRSKEGEPFWESPWGKGRPGWHIECSCMSMNELQGATLDIHAGGQDLIFPHHENEIAQSEALTGQPFAKYWIHHGLLTIKGQKMSKSLGNFITVGEVLERYPRDILKLFFLQSHYASPVDFSWEKMEEATKAYERINILMRKLDKINEATEGQNGQGAGRRREKKEKFTQAMDDDMNTPKALAVLYDTVNDCNKLIESHAEGKQLTLRDAMDFIRETGSIFGIDFVEKLQISGEEEQLLSERLEARRNKDFQRSDELRALLKEKGIVVEDTKDGQVWRRA